MAKAVSEKGLKLIAITDHGPQMPGDLHPFYFGNFEVIPEYIYGVRVLKGAEVNILPGGELDLSEYWLKRLEFAAAGIHPVAYKNSTKKENTRAIIEVIKNPYIKMITHPDNPNFPVDFEEIVRAAKEYNVILELNDSSFDGTKARGIKEDILKMCELMKKFNVLTSINSDAHWVDKIGSAENVINIALEAGLTEENIINTSFKRILDFIDSRKYLK